MTRILIVDDHEVVRSGLRSIVEAHEGWQVDAEASDGNEAITKAIETRPDVAIIDFSLPWMNVNEVTRQIRASAPSVEVLIFSMHDSADLKSQAGLLDHATERASQTEFQLDQLASRLGTTRQMALEGFQAQLDAVVDLSRC